MSDCLFCKIIRGEIPSYKVYEDDATFAFLDIHPVKPGHTLVVSKTHTASLTDLPLSAATSWLVTIQLIGRAIKSALNVEGLNFMLNDGAAAGQVVPHVHMHIIPRNTGDGLKHWTNGEYASKDEAEGIAERIKDKCGNRSEQNPSVPLDVSPS